MRQYIPPLQYLALVFLHHHSAIVFLLVGEVREFDLVAYKSSSEGSWEWLIFI
jgi:hypothetical protein